MGRYLVMYDLSGIQSFIFSTNRVKEIVGASYLVSCTLFVNVPKLLGETPFAWRAYQPKDYTSLGEDQGKTVYIGGGNALVLFGSADAACSFTKRLKRMVFLQTGGALRICSARVKANESTRLSECLDPTNDLGLMALLDRSKSKSPHALTARGFSISALDNDSKEPIVYFKNAIHDQGSKHKFMSRAKRLKLQAYEEQRNIKGIEGASSPLLDLMGGQEYEVEFDEFFKESDAKNKGKHYLAIVHIDGNTMGQRISSFLRGLSQTKDSLEEDLAAMRDLSAFISDAYRNALSSAINEVFGSEGDRPLAFRPVVADGDDITFICRSEKAFACVEAFVKALHNPAKRQSAAEGMPRPEDLSVGVGIAFVNSSYPFSNAYAMAEELCKNAKKTALLRFGTKPQRPVSSVDFQVCSGELVGDVGDFRDRRLTLASTDNHAPTRLCIRPYYIVEDEFPIEPELRFGSFVAQVQELLARSNASECEGGAWVARSKLKGLRDKYGQGLDQAKRYGQIICERNMALQRMGAVGGDDRKDFVKSFADPFMSLSDPESGTAATYATFFDALDVLDLCEDVRKEADAE